MNDEFTDWLQKSDIEVNCIPAKVKYGNGLKFADEERRELVRVPADMLITPQLVVDYAENEPLLKALLHRDDLGIDTKDINLAPRKIITRFLIFQILAIRRGTPDMKFASWVRSLPPSKEMNLPVSWEEEDVESLITTSIYSATASKTKHLKQTYTNLFNSKELRERIAHYVASGGRQDLTPVDCEVTLNDWTLVDQWVSSRSLGFPGEDGTTEIAMVPVIDLVNHDDEPTAVYVLNDETGGVDLITLKHCPGEEVTIHYGQERGAGEFLFTYGFIPNGLQTARKLTFFHDVMDTKYRKCLDPDHNPAKQTDEDSDEIDPESSYEILFALCGERYNPTTFSDIGGNPTWHDNFIALHCCGSDLNVVHDAESGYVALHFRDEPVDISNAQDFIARKDPEFYADTVLPRGNLAIVTLIEEMYLLKPEDAPRNHHQLHELEQKLLQAVISSAKRNTRED